MNPVTNFEKWINSIATGTAPDIPPVTRFEHFLNKIRLAIARKSDITSGLPDVTAEDNDKVLTVVEGAWDKAAPSGGGTFVVLDTREGNTHTLNKTFGEIEGAIEAGKTVWIIIGTNGTAKRMVTIFDPVIQVKDAYEGSFGIVAEDATYWYATGDTEEEARNSYPSYDDV